MFENKGVISGMYFSWNQTPYVVVKSMVIQILIALAVLNVAILFKNKGVISGMYFSWNQSP